MSNGGDVIINGGSGGGTGCGGMVTISTGNSKSSEKELIENNPCWPYTVPDSISELDISGPTVEEYLTSLETFRKVWFLELSDEEIE